MCAVFTANVRILEKYAQTQRRKLNSEWCSTLLLLFTWTKRRAWNKNVINFVFRIMPRALVFAFSFHQIQTYTYCIIRTYSILVFAQSRIDFNVSVFLLCLLSFIQSWPGLSKCSQNLNCNFISFHSRLTRKCVFYTCFFVCEMAIRFFLVNREPRMWGKLHFICNAYGIKIDLLCVFCRKKPMIFTFHIIGSGDTFANA